MTPLNAATKGVMRMLVFELGRRRLTELGEVAGLPGDPRRTSLATT